MTRGGSSVQWVYVAATVRRHAGGEPCAALACEREGRLREGAVGVTVSGPSGGGSGGELPLLRRVRARSRVWCRREEVMRTAGHTTDRATRTDSGTRSAQV